MGEYFGRKHEWTRWSSDRLVDKRLSSDSCNCERGNFSSTFRDSVSFFLQIKKNTNKSVSYENKNIKMYK